MTTAIILHLNDSLLREKPFMNEGKLKAYAAKHRSTGYEIVARVVTDHEGQEAAEEMFDLTNNPSRDYERYRKVGHQRSVSTGDIIHVDGTDWVCLSFGWAAL